MGRVLAASCASCLLLCLPPRARAETVVIDDPLDGKTAGEVVGGTLSADGYLPGVGANHILYRLPAPVKEGVITVELKGFDGRADDNGFVAMYDGRGIPEPTIFEAGENDGFRPFRENYFRFNAHWRDGALFKSVLILASPERAHGVDPMTKAASYWRPVSGPPSPRDFTTEPNGTAYAWKPAAWATLKIEWRKVANRVQFAVFMDAQRVWGPVQAPAGWEYHPREHRIWLGSGPGPMKYESKSATTVFRNFKLVALADAVPPLAGARDGGGAATDAPIPDATASPPEAGATDAKDGGTAPVETPAATPEPTPRDARAAVDGAEPDASSGRPANPPATAPARSAPGCHAAGGGASPSLALLALLALAAGRLRR